MIITKEGLREIFCTLNGGQLRMMKDENDLINKIWQRFFAFDLRVAAPLESIESQDVIEVLSILLDPSIDSEI